MTQHVELPIAAPPDDSFGWRCEDLDWIDAFVTNIRPYVRLRREDGVLIKMPSEVYQINPGGAALLGRALAGETIGQILLSADAASHPERIRQIHTFFCDVRDLLAGRLADAAGRASIQVAPYTGSFTRYPVLSEIALTYRCNLACTFCYAGCGTPDATPGNPANEKHGDSWKLWRRSRWWQRRHPARDPLRQEMSAAEVFRVIDQVATAGHVPSVSFTGGECTLRPELPDFVARARQCGMRVNLITNGIVCASRGYVARLVDAGLTSAQVSLEGPTAAVHDRLTQRPGSFDKTLRGIGNLRDAGLYVHTNTTVCEENAEHLTAVVDLARSLELPHLSMNQLIPTGTPNLPRHRTLKVSYTRIGPLVVRVKEHAARAGIDFHWYSPTPFCIFNPIRHGLGNKGCAACDGLLHVSPSGEVLPCSSFARGVGNLLELGFEAVWFGKRAQYYKNKQHAPRRCRRCEHFPLCQGACTLYWSGMGCGELYQAKRQGGPET